MIHDAVRRGHDDVTELARRQQVGDPLLNVVDRHIETRRDDTGLVDAADQIDDDLARAVVVDNLELANVACASTRDGLAICGWPLLASQEKHPLASVVDDRRRAPSLTPPRLRALTMRRGLSSNAPRCMCIGSSRWRETTTAAIRTVLLHHLKELDDDLGAGADHHLTEAALLGVADALESIGEHTDTDHAV